MKVVVMTPEPATLLRMVAASRHQLVGVSCGDTSSMDGTMFGALRERWHGVRQAPSLQYWAKTYRIPHRCYVAEQAGDFAAWLARLGPDLLITCKAPLLPESVFLVPRFGSINVHYALLPNYRGGAPLLWQVVNGEHQGGVTMHFIDAGIDTGAIIRQRPVALPQGASERQLDQLLNGVAATILPEALDAVATGYAGRPAVCDSDSVFAGNVQQQSLIDFIDWDDWPIEKVWRVLRFMEYWPTSRGLKGVWQRCVRWKVGRIRPMQRSDVTSWHL